MLSRPGREPEPMDRPPLVDPANTLTGPIPTASIPLSFPPTAATSGPSGIPTRYKLLKEAEGVELGRLNDDRGSHFVVVTPEAVIGSYTRYLDAYAEFQALAP